MEENLNSPEEPQDIQAEFEDATQEVLKPSLPIAPDGELESILRISKWAYDCNI